MRETTHRQYLAWQEWLDLRWDNPDLTQQYLMQIAQRLEQLPHYESKGGNPNRVTLESQKILFERRSTQELQAEKEQREKTHQELVLQRAKARASRLGAK
jgi:hypothetical protein